MRASRIDEASALARRIGQVIQYRNSIHLRRTDKADLSDMWRKVRQITGRQNRRFETPLGITADVLNQHYANISNDTSYQPSTLKSTCCPRPDSISEYQVFRALDHLHNTATGLDGIPAWFLRLGAPVFSDPIAKLYNLSIATATVPYQWKVASITPIAKVTHPAVASDFRPISITSVMSRTMERIVVRSYIYPALLSSPSPNLNFSDQFAFRPTGSTTAALITLLHTITSMLARSPYVRVIALDFSKAFDSVRHSTLLHKVSSLPLPDEIYNSG